WLSVHARLIDASAAVGRIRIERDVLGRDRVRSRLLGVDRYGIGGSGRVDALAELLRRARWRLAGRRIGLTHVGRRRVDVALQRVAGRIADRLRVGLYEIVLIRWPLRPDDPVDTEAQDLDVDGRRRTLAERGDETFGGVRVRFRLRFGDGALRLIDVLL